MNFKQQVINLLKHYNQSWRLDPDDDIDLKECDISDEKLLNAVEAVFKAFEETN